MTEENQAENNKIRPAERYLQKLISGNIEAFPKLEGIPPHLAKILLDSVTNWMYEDKNMHDGNKPNYAWLARERGIYVDFEANGNYKGPYRKAGLSDDVVTYIYPDNGYTDEEKIIFQEEKLKIYESINVAIQNEHIRQAIATFTENELIDFAKKYDPYERNTSELEKYLLDRKQARQNEK